VRVSSVVEIDLFELCLSLSASAFLFLFIFSVEKMKGKAESDGLAELNKVNFNTQESGTLFKTNCRAAF